MGEEERALVRAAKGGDAQAFAELYRHYLPRIFRFCLARLGTREDAEDATSVTFANLARGLARYDDRGIPFAAYVFRIARNAIVDATRRRRPSDPLESAEEVAAPASATPDGVALSDRAELLSALRTLPELHREVLSLRFVEGYEAAEVARILGKSEGAVRSIQHRALEQLRDTLGAADLEPKEATR